MKQSKLIVLGLLVMLMSASVALAAETYVRKVDNFIFLVDTSGSMGGKYMYSQNPKIEDAVGILERINKAIPELGYQGGLSTVAPAKSIADMAAYERGAYGAAIVKIPVKLGNRSTPIGDGLNALEPALRTLVGRTAVILVSDGQENESTAPVKVAKALADKYGVCFHVIGFADPVNGGQKTLDGIAAINPSCTVAVTGQQMQDQAALEKFVRDVFYDVTGAAEVDGDDDQDGVLNSKDKCPGTPRDLAVDADGCPIPVKMKLKVNFDFDKSDVKPMYHQELADFAQFAKQYPDVDIEIAGHTDGKGTPAYNLKLSQRRANSVREYLIQKFGMKPARLSAIGYGLTKPIADNNTDEGRAENRRIEAVLKGVYQKR